MQERKRKKIEKESACVWKYVCMCVYVCKRVRKRYDISDLILIFIFSTRNVERKSVFSKRVQKNDADNYGRYS